MLSSRTFDIDIALAPARRALGFARCGRWALHGVICGAITSSLILIIASVWTIPESHTMAAVALVAGPLVGAGAACLRWPSAHEAARATDRHFLLGDRVTTALEFRHSQEPFLVLQRTDAAHAVRGLPLHRVARGRPRWGERAWAVGAMMLVGVLALQGSARSTAVTGTRAQYAEQQIQRAGAVSVLAMTRAMSQTAGSSRKQDPSLSRLQAELDRLRRQFQQPISLEQALRAISVSQQRLARLDAEIRPLSAPALAQLNRALEGMVPTSGTPRSMDAGSTSRSLARLIASLRYMSAAQRQAAARTLDRTAKAISDGRLQTILRRAATALSAKNTASAAVFLKQGVTLLRDQPQAQRTRALIRASTSRLDRLKNALSAIQRRSLLRPTPTAANAATPGRASGTKSGKQGKTGHRKSTATRLAGQAWKPTNERTASKDQRVITNVRRAGQGGRVNDDPRYSIQKSRAARATVYVRGREGNGTRLLQNGSRAAVSQTRQQQYRQILMRYASSARAALDHGALPPSVQTYVRQYFSEISQ